MSILSDVRGLFYPSLCPVCGGELPEGGRTVCTLCRMTAPLTRFWEQADNPMMRRLWGHVPVVGAAAFIWYVEGSGWQRLIHAFKYHGQWRLALEMGTWYGACLADSGAFADADALVPVPLHWIRRLGRGIQPVGIPRGGPCPCIGQARVDGDSAASEEQPQPNRCADARPLEQRARPLCAPPTGKAGRTSYPARGRRIHHRCDAGLLRGGDPRSRARLPDQHSDAGCLGPKPRPRPQGMSPSGASLPPRRRFCGKSPRSFDLSVRLPTFGG